MLHLWVITMDKEKSLRIYLLINIFSIVFMILFFVWVFKLGPLNEVTSRSYWLIVIPYVVLINVFSAYAKKVGGGMLNPARTNKKAILFKYVSWMFFIGGLLLGVFVERQLTYVALIAIPFEVMRVYVAHKLGDENAQSEILDDFEIE